VLGTVNPIRAVTEIAYAAGPLSSSTACKRPRISPLTCRRSAVISARCPATQCTGRPASASSTDGASCSRRCPPTRKAAT
jgi:hypothetical protein